MVCLTWLAIWVEDGGGGWPCQRALCSGRLPLGATSQRGPPEPKKWRGDHCVLHRFTWPWYYLPGAVKCFQAMLQFCDVSEWLNKPFPPKETGVAFPLIPAWAIKLQWLALSALWQLTCRHTSGCDAGVAGWPGGGGLDHVLNQNISKFLLIFTPNLFSQFRICVFFHVKRKISPLLGFLADISLWWGSGLGGLLWMLAVSHSAVLWHFHKIPTTEILVITKTCGFFL